MLIVVRARVYQRLVLLLRLLRRARLVGGIAVGYSVAVPLRPLVSLALGCCVGCVDDTDVDDVDYIDDVADVVDVVDVGLILVGRL